MNHRVWDLVHGRWRVGYRTLVRGFIRVHKGEKGVGLSRESQFPTSSKLSFSSLPILPLSESEEEALRGCGLRHRSAFSLSKLTGALI